MEPRGAVIAELKAEHRAMEQLLSRIEALPSGDRRRKRLAGQMTRALVRLAVAEETHLYPVLRRHLPHGDRVTSRVIVQHAEIERLLKLLECWPAGTEEFDQLLGKVIRMVRDHVSHKERHLAPLLRGKTVRHEVDGLVHKLRDTKRKAPTRPHPIIPAHPLAHRVLSPVVGLTDRVRDALGGHGTSPQPARAQGPFTREASEREAFGYGAAERDEPERSGAEGDGVEQRGQSEPGRALTAPLDDRGPSRP